jgi:hypothetical protein
LIVLQRATGGAGAYSNRVSPAADAAALALTGANNLRFERYVIK